MIARSATPPARETGAFKGQRHHPHGLAGVEIACPRQALARLSPRTGRGVRDRDRRRPRRRRPGLSQEYVGLDLAPPDIGPRASKVKLGRAAGQDDDDVFALIWNL